MASPQKENGYTKIANELYDAIIRWHLSSYEFRVLIFIIRKTYGWDKKEDWISLSQFAEGTHIQHVHVCRALRMLQQQKIITKGGKRTNPKYGVQKDYDLWLELPKGVRSHHQLQSLPKGVINVTKGGNQLVPKGAHTKETITKETITKEIIHKNVLNKFGNSDINNLSSYFLQVFQIPKEDCTQKQSRQYWYHLLRESKTGEAGVRWLIDQAYKDEFYKNNITSSKDLYYKRIKIIARKRGNIPIVAVMPKEVI